MTQPELRVALFTDSDVFAGTERHMLDLAHGLRSAGVSVRFLTPGGVPLAQKALADDFAHTPVEKRGLLDRAAVGTVQGLLRRGEIDVVHAHNGRTALSAALAVTWARRGVCIATQHFLEPGHLAHHGPKAVLFRAAHRWVDRSVHEYIAISQAVRDAMQAHSSTPPDRITVIPNGLRAPQQNLQSVAHVREALGIGQDAPLIVCASRLEPEKDIGTLIAAMKLVKTSHPDAVCIVAGMGALKEALEAQIREADLTDTVRLLGFRSDVLSLIQAGNVFALASRAEPFGLVLLEAMALARPVVATSKGGPAEIVLPGVTGLLVPPANAPEFADAIRTLLDAPEQARQMGQAGQQRYADRFTVEKMAAATLQVYRKAGGCDERRS